VVVLTSCALQDQFQSMPMSSTERVKTPISPPPVSDD
jgi:hypothetical protein